MNPSVLEKQIQELERGADKAERALSRAYQKYFVLTGHEYESPYSEQEI